MTQRSGGSDTSQAPQRLGLVGSTVAMVALHVFQRGAGLLSMTVIARLLRPSELGAYAFTQSTNQTFWGFLRLGVDAGIHARLARLDPGKDKPETEVLLGQAALMTLAIAVIGSALMAVLSQPIAARLFGAPDLSPFVTIAAVLFFGQAMAQLCYAAFAGLHAFATYSRITSIGTVLMLSSAVTGAYLGGAPSAAIGLAVGQVTLALMLVVALSRHMVAQSLTVRLALPGPELGAALAIGFPFYAAGLFVVPAEFAAQAVLSRTAGVEALGELRVVLALLAVVQVIPNGLAGPMVSLMGEREGREAGAAARASVAYLRVLWILSLGVAIPLAGLWPLLIRFIFGSSYTMAEQVGHLALASLIPMIIGTALTSALLASGRSRVLFFVGLVQAAILIGLAWLAIPALGLAGLFVAQGVASAAAVVLWFRALIRRDGEASSSQPIVVLAALTALLLALLVADVRFDESWPQRAAAYAGAVVAMWVVLWRAAIDPTERVTLRRFAARAPQMIRDRMGLAG